MRRLSSLLVLLWLVAAVPAWPQTTKSTKKSTAHKSTTKSKSGHTKGGGSSSSVGGNFTPECATLPFESIATKPDPFVQCNNCGVVGATNPDPAAAGLFSHTKNNFCADFSQPTPVTFALLRNMQKQTKVGKVALDDRSQLQRFFSVGNKKIGEGDVVRLVAWIKAAHVSDCSSGETVNCNIPGFASNDIHIVLVDPGSGGVAQDECSSATAEMSPHFRPAAWSSLDLKTPNKNVVRFTGPLFYDNAHEPCNGLSDAANPKASPKRSSLWEIHPVYQFDVCTSANPKQCDVNSTDTALWVPYDKWVTQAGSSTIPTGQTFRTNCKSGPQKTGVVAPQCPVNSH